MIQYITIGASVHRLPLTKQRVKSKFNNYLHSDVSHPFLVDLVRTAVLRERLHVAGRTFELPEVLVAVIQKQILIVDVIA